MRTKWQAIRCVMAAGMLAGCAQTVWMRPGTSLEEANVQQERCSLQAQAATPNADVHFRGGRHTSGQLGAALGEALVDGVVDAIRQSAAAESCMVASGFHRERLQPATDVQFAAAPAPSPAPDPGPAFIGSTGAPGPVTGASLGRMAARPPIVLEARADANLWTEPLLFDRRRLLIQDVMGLPDKARTKLSFLLGACSAGDASACIMSDALGPRRSNRY